MSKIGIIIQARMGATRLPGKVMRHLSESPVLWHVVERCKKTNVNEIIVATSTNPENDIIEQFCLKNKFNVFRGSEDDVLKRYYLAAKQFKLDIIIRITADCPLISPEIIDKCIKTLLKEKADYVSNVATRSFPRGLDVEVFSFSALEKANNLAKEKPEREHVTAFIYAHPEMFNIKQIVASGKLERPDLRLCIDTPEDYKLLSIIYDKFYSGTIIDIEKVMDFLSQNSELAMSNIASEKEHLEKNKKDNIKQTILNK